MATELTYHVPTSVADLKKPKPILLGLRMQSFIREYVADEEAQALMRGASGEGPSLTGHPRWDAHEMINVYRTRAANNGFADLGALPAYRFWRVFCSAWKPVAGFAFGRLLAQGVHQKRLTDQSARDED